MNEATGTEAADLDFSRPGPAELRRILRGFSCMFWGMPLTLMLFFDAVQLALFERIRIPSYVFGMVVIYLGMGFLCFCGVESRSWRRMARSGLFSAFLLIYFVPVVYWYTTLPRVGVYYTVNLIALLFSALWLMWSSSQLASRLGVLTGDLDLAVEARVCAWSVVVLMMAPLSVVLVLSGVLAVRYESTLLSEVEGFRTVMPVWSQVFFLLPLSLTMVAVWKAKERCLLTLSGEDTRNP